MDILTWSFRGKKVSTGSDSSELGASIVNVFTFVLDIILIHEAVSTDNQGLLQVILLAEFQATAIRLFAFRSSKSKWIPIQAVLGLRLFEEVPERMLIWTEYADLLESSVTFFATLKEWCADTGPNETSILSLVELCALGFIFLHRVVFGEGVSIFRAILPLLIVAFCGGTTMFVVEVPNSVAAKAFTYGTVSSGIIFLVLALFGPQLLKMGEKVHTKQVSSNAKEEYRALRGKKKGNLRKLSVLLLIVLLGFFAALEHAWLTQAVWSDFYNSDSCWKQVITTLSLVFWMSTAVISSLALYLRPAKFVLKCVKDDEQQKTKVKPSV